MSAITYIMRSLAQHWRIHLAVALGVMAATAVLTGALLVGDSVRGSLRALTLDRLGSIDEVLVTTRFFREELAAETASKPGFKEHYSAITPAIFFPRGVVEQKDNEDLPPRRAAGVTVLGAGEGFWAMGDGPRPEIGKGEVVLNEALARELNLDGKDLTEKEYLVTLRFPKFNQVPAENPLGEKEDIVRSLPRLKVVQIIPATGLGRFGLHPAQGLPLNAYVSLETLQGALDQPGKVNALFAAGKSPTSPPGEEASRALAAALQPTFEDYGFILTEAKKTVPAGADAAKPGATVFDYFSFSSDRMILEADALAAAKKAYAAEKPQPVVTYLANALVKLTPEQQKPGGPQPGPEDGIAYSMITGIGMGKSFPLKGKDGDTITSLADDEIVLNSWTAEKLEASLGDVIRVYYFKPETADGEAEEIHRDFKLAAITPLTEPAEPYADEDPPVFKKAPTLANDPDLTPFVPGVTDTESIEEWDLPFEMTRPIDGDDDNYWNNHRTTPKAFVSLETGQKLFGSRFGDTTSLRISRTGADGGKRLEAAALKADFLKAASDDDVDLGFAFIPLKRRQLQASAGATPFDVLFLLLSMFIIAAAVMLISLLFRLGVEQRASELGLLAATGLTRWQVAKLMMGEAAVVALFGGVAGILLGTGYAALMILGLTTWWVGAISTPFLELHVTAQSLLIGLVSGVLISLATIAWRIWQTRKISARRLLSGQASAPVTRASSRVGVVWLAVAGLLLVAAIGLAVLATSLGGEAQAGAFMGGGFAVLTALLILAWRLLEHGGWFGGVTRSLTGLVLRNAARNPGRSTLTIGLISVSAFLIAAVSSFHLSPTDSGTGGFSMFAESSLPIYEDINRSEDKPAGANIVSLRLRAGDDASCNNLYQAAQPRVIGITPAMVKHFDEVARKNAAAKDGDALPAFEWAASAASGDQVENPWRLLNDKPTPAGEPIPVVIDKNTAMYSLKLYAGVGEQFTIEYDDGPVTFKVAGLLANSILQGSLLIGEQDFKQQFPAASGYRYFLIQPEAGAADQTASALEEAYGDQGFDAKSSVELLTQLLAVQNTYLSTFQSLGALGLLLGVVGLGAAQLRSVLERRSELALLRATGFSRTQLGQMVMMEHLLLLTDGLLIGVLAAAVSVAPHYFTGGAQGIPLLDLLAMLAGIFIAGAVAGFAAMQATLTAPLLGALRGD